MAEQEFFAPHRIWAVVESTPEKLSKTLGTYTSVLTFSLSTVTNPSSFGKLWTFDRCNWRAPQSFKKFYLIISKRFCLETFKICKVSQKLSQPLWNAKTTLSRHAYVEFKSFLDCGGGFRIKCWQLPLQREFSLSNSVPLPTPRA